MLNNKFEETSNRMRSDSLDQAEIECSSQKHYMGLHRKELSNLSVHD